MTTDNNNKNNSQGQNRENDNKLNLSDAAKIMRSSSDPEERSKAAQVMGAKGGSHSHKGSSSGETNRQDDHD